MRPTWPKRDVTENRRYGVAPSLALGLGTANRLTAAISTSPNGLTSLDYGISWYFNNAVSGSAHYNYYGFRDGNYPGGQMLTMADPSTWSHDISDWAILRNHFSRWPTSPRCQNYLSAVATRRPPGSITNLATPARPDLRLNRKPDTRLPVTNGPALGSTSMPTAHPVNTLGNPATLS